MSIITDNWIKWFESRESVDLVNNEAQEELFAAFNLSIEEDECKKKLIDHQEVLFLFKEIFGNKINVFHHIIEIGGTVYDNKVDFCLIEGVDKESATFMTPDIDVLFEKPSGRAVVVPNAADIFAVTNIEEIQALANGTSNYKPRNFIPIAPFLCQAVCESIEKSGGDSEKLLLAVVLAIKAFDTEYATNSEYK